MKDSIKRLSIQDEELGIKKVFSVLGKHKLTTLFIVLLFLFGGIVYSYFAQPTYETYSTVEVSNDQIDLSLDAVARGQGIGQDTTLIDTQIEILRSRNLIEKAQKRVSYQIRYFTTRNYKTTELYKNNPFEIAELKVKDPLFYGTTFIIEPIDENTFYMKASRGGLITVIIKTLYSLAGKDISELRYEGKHHFGEKIDNEYFSMVIKKKGELTNPQYSFVVIDLDSAVKSVASRLNVVAASQNSSIIKIFYQDNNAQRAKDFLDSLVDLYLDQSIQQKTAQASSALTFVDQQLKEVSKKLQESAIRLENFKEENNVINIDTESDVTLRKLSDFQTRLSEIKIQEGTFNAVYEEFRSGNYEAVSALATDYPVLATLLESLQAAKAEKIDLLSTFMPNHPDVQEVDRKIEDIKMSLESAIESINDEIREKKRSLEDTIYANETMLLRLPEKERELAELQRKYEVNEKTYLFLLEKQAEMSINKASTVSSNRVLDRATVEKRPIKPAIPMILVASLLLGLIVAIAILLIRDFLDDKIKTKNDLTNNTKIPFYGMIPFIKSSNSIFVLDDNQSIASEALRLIRTNLEFTPANNKGKAVLITSTVPGEGKTTVATNLAAVFGMSEKKCIVLSLDMRRPMLHKVFALTNKIGMSTVLSGKNELREVIWEHKKIKNLDIITSGPIPPNPSELLQSGKVNEIINELREEYDYVIIDSPPVGAISDTLVLMKMVDISLIVFRSEFSEKEYVKSIDEMVRTYDLKNVGLILNAVKPNNISQGFFKYSYTYK